MRWIPENPLFFLQAFLCALTRVPLLFSSVSPCWPLCWLSSFFFRVSTSTPGPFKQRPVFEGFFSLIFNLLFGLCAVHLLFFSARVFFSSFLIGRPQVAFSICSSFFFLGLNPTHIKIYLSCPPLLYTSLAALLYSRCLWTQYPPPSHVTFVWICPFTRHLTHPPVCFFKYPRRGFLNYKLEEIFAPSLFFVRTPGPFSRCL